MEHCKYANSGSWDVVSDDVVWNSHLDCLSTFVACEQQLM